MNSAIVTPPPAFVRRIFLKDVRLLRYPLLLLLLLALSIALTWLGPDQIKDGTYVYQLMRWFLPAAALLVAVPLINADPTGREFRFLLTRPVPGSAIGIAKALFLCLFIIIPCWLVLEMDIACSRVPLSLGDHLLLLLETAVRCGAGLAALALCCMLLRKSIFVAIFALIAVVAATRWIGSPPFFHAGPPYPTVDHVRLFRARAFLALAAFLGVSLVAIAARYRSRGFKAPLVVLAAAIPLCLLADLSPAGIMPLRLNAAFCSRRSRYQLTRIEPSDYEVRVEMEHYSVPLTLRGDLVDWGGGDGWNMADLPQVLAVYRPFKEVLNTRGSGGGNIGGSPGVNGANLSWDFGRIYSMTNYPLGHPNYGQPLPNGWASGVELYFIGNDRCGQVDIPYEIDNIDLSLNQRYSETFQPPQ